MKKGDKVQLVKGTSFFHNDIKEYVTVDGISDCVIKDDGIYTIVNIGESGTIVIEREVPRGLIRHYVRSGNIQKVDTRINRTYTIGDFFVNDDTGIVFILSQVEIRMVNMISLEDGNRKSSPVPVDSTTEIKGTEIESLLNGTMRLRYIPKMEASGRLRTFKIGERYGSC